MSTTIRQLPPSTPVMHLSIEELKDLITRAVEEKLEELRPQRIVRGLEAVAELLHVSKSQAANIKNDPKYAECFRQEGRIILADADKLLATYGKGEGASQLLAKALRPASCRKKAALAICGVRGNL